MHSLVGAYCCCSPFLQDANSTAEAIDLKDAVLSASEAGIPEAFSITTKADAKSKAKKIVLVASSEADKEDWLTALQTVFDMMRVSCMRVVFLHLIPHVQPSNIELVKSIDNGGAVVCAALIDPSTVWSGSIDPLLRVYTGFQSAGAKDLTVRCLRSLRP